MAYQQNPDEVEVEVGAEHSMTIDNTPPDMSVIETMLNSSMEINVEFIKNVFRRMVREIQRRGRNFELVDFLKGRYDDCLELVVCLDFEYLRSQRPIWIQENQDSLLSTIYDQVDECIISAVFGILATEKYSTLKQDDWLKRILCTCLKTRRNDGCSRNATRDGEADMCVVCLEPLHRKDEISIATIHCGHEYHCDCIESWLARGNNSCPLCRSKVITGRKSFLQSGFDNH